MSTYDIAGNISFRLKRGARNTAQAEQDIENALLETSNIMAAKFPNIQISTSSLAVNQQLSERLKA